MPITKCETYASHVRACHKMRRTIVIWEAARYNLRRRSIELKVGDRILKISTKLSYKADDKAGKLFDKYEGPYIIKRKISPTVYELKNLKGKSAGEWNETARSRFSASF